MISGYARRPIRQTRQNFCEYSIRLKRNERSERSVRYSRRNDHRADTRGAEKQAVSPSRKRTTPSERALALEASVRQLNLMASHELNTNEKNECIYRSARQQQHHGIVRCAAGEYEVDRPKNAAGAGPAGQKNQVGSLTLADSFHGTACRMSTEGI